MGANAHKDYVAAVAVIAACFAVDGWGDLLDQFQIFLYLLAI